MSAFLLIAGCARSDELTRDLAAEKIEEALLAKGEQTYALTEQGFDLGVQLGYWDKEGRLTDKGQEIASTVSRASIRPNTAPDYTVEVTGMTDAATVQGAKEVQFTLSNDAAQGTVRYFIIAGGSGAALFRKFDDGWRAELVTFQKSPAGLALSETEQRELEAESAAEALRRAELYKQATTATTNTDFVCDSHLDGRFLQSSVTVTDVSISVEEDGFRRGFHVFLFKDVGNAYVESFYGKRIVMDTARGRINFYQDCPDIGAVFNTLQTNLAAWRQKWSGVDLSGG